MKKIKLDMKYTTSAAHLNKMLFILVKGKNFSLKGLCTLRLKLYDTVRKMKLGRQLKDQRLTGFSGDG